MANKRDRDGKLIAGFVMLIMSFTLFKGVIFLRLLFLFFGLKYLFDYNKIRTERTNRGSEKESYPVNPRHRPDWKADQDRTQDRRQQEIDKVKRNQVIQAGKKAFSDYDYKAAEKIFEKGVSEFPDDPVFHFNLACCYSLLEKESQSLHQLKEAIKHGFDDIEKIESHDALAFLRIQPSFEAFKKDGYEVQNNNASILDDEDLLDKLERLKGLRDRGILNEAEFNVQKEKLLNKS